MQGSPSFWTSCTALLPHGDLYPCLFLCMVHQTAIKWFILPHLLHFLPYTGKCLCRCHESQYLQFSTIFFSFPLAYCHILPVSSCWVKLSRLLYCLTPPSVAIVPLLSGPTLLPAHCSPHWYLSRLLTLMITAIMVSSSRPFMNCSFSILFFSLLLQFMA